MKYVLSNKNKKFKIVDGYTFRVEKTIENTMYLRCTEHHCKSRMIIKSESITKGPSDYEHVADASKLHARIVVANMKNEAYSHTTVTTTNNKCYTNTSWSGGSYVINKFNKKYTSSNSQKERLRPYGSKIAF